MATVFHKIGLVDILINFGNIIVAYWAAFFLAKNVLLSNADIIANHGAAAGEIGKKQLQFAGGFHLLNVGLELFGG